jgi:hypothetical protein
MYKSGFDKLFWGFFFIMIDFKLNGFDIFPDIIGYILFAIGFGILATNSIYFERARNYNIPMIILSIFSIYEKPAEVTGGVHLGQFGLIGVVLTILSIALTLLVVYNLFMGIKDMAEKQGLMFIYDDADSCWRQFIFLQLAALLIFVLIFIPVFALVFIIVMFVLSIVITFSIMRFMKKCGEVF